MKGRNAHALLDHVNRHVAPLRGMHPDRGRSRVHEFHKWRRDPAPVLVVVERPFNDGIPPLVPEKVVDKDARVPGR
jgi:hypothetical protein